MQFVKNGPDIPIELLQAQEEGKLVFFCGAGVSFAAKLPGFKGLVELIYESAGEEKNRQEEREFDACNYDRVLGLLENRLQPGIVRSAIISSLSLTETSNVETHNAILTLSKNKRGAYRLITTNFDRGFILAGVNENEVDVGPKLPVPKDSKWTRLVHLHGLIRSSDRGGANLVVTSADFGAAYLTERWASRFVTELFQRFTVLFIGYSIEDPVMRYVLDALSADRARGDQSCKAYVLAGYRKRKRREEKKDIEDDWASKSVIPIMYNQRYNHSDLHKSLRAWADVARDGLSGKKHLIARCARTAPKRPFGEEASQVCWALREKDGTTARHFANLDPTPPVEWLEVLEAEGLLAYACSDDQESIPVPLVDHGNITSNPAPLHPVTKALAGWMVKHLETDKLVQWVLKSGRALHMDFQNEIRFRFSKDQIREPYHLFWRIFTSGLVHSNIHGWSHFYEFDLLDRIKAGKLDLLIKEEILQALMPRFSLGDNWGYIFEDEPKKQDARKEKFSLNSLIDLSIEFQMGQRADYIVKQIMEMENNDQILSDLSFNLTDLLEYSLSLLELVGRVSEGEDFSYISIPSISLHPQNDRGDSWTTLIELVRDSWLSLLKSDAARAKTLVELWKDKKYPLFIRLAFFAMTHSQLYGPEEACSFLLSNNDWWLWSIMVEREKFRLLDRIWPDLNEKNTDLLISAIISGPPRNMFRNDLSEDEWQEIVERDQWLHLSKLESFGRSLPEIGAKKLSDLRGRHQKWKLQDNEKDEFPTWSESYWGPRTEYTIDQLCELTNEKLVQILQNQKNREQEDLLYQWRLAVEKCTDRAMSLINFLVQQKAWNSVIWEATIGGFRSTDSQFSIWANLNKPLSTIPDVLVKEISSTLASWLRDQTKELPVNKEASFWMLWDTLLPHAVQKDVGESTSAVTAAINHPVGYLAEALIDRLWARKPTNNQLLPDVFLKRANLLIVGKNEAHLLGKVVLSSRLKDLFLVDPSWASDNLIPLFSWESELTAKAVWQGYLWEPRMTPDLLVEMKDYFLEALKRHEKLGGSGKKLFQLFTYICLDPAALITKKEMREILKAVGTEGRREISETIYRYLKDSGEQSSVLWKNRVGPWIKQVWPKDLDAVDHESSRMLAQAAILTADSFEKAATQIKRLLAPTEHFGNIVRLFKKSTHPEKYPDASLMILASTVSEKHKWPNKELREVLKRIAIAKPKIRDKQDYKNLNEYLERVGS